jgi:hypothetical protein
VVDLSEYCSYDTSLFNIKYKKNNSENFYIQNGQARLYAANGNGNSIEINAAAGVKIKNISYVDANGRTVSVTISNDGSSAIIQNKTNSGSSQSNQIRLTSISITYETSVSGMSYEIEEGSLHLKYVLQLSESEYNLYQTSGKKLELKVNGETASYSVSKVQVGYGSPNSFIITIPNLDGNYGIQYGVSVTATISETGTFKETVTKNITGTEIINRLKALETKVGI